MTHLEQHRIAALSSASFLPGSRDKRMIRILSSRVTSNDREPLTEFQSREIERLALKCRRRIPSSLVPEARPDGARL
jgi:hypothetical protein